ncbi:hypothetical protein WN944_001710 [Citrus x changshan-huyou]|uniref:Transposase-associated domain-containing protein n=1 Tax=Citrus x changshan-huyou TaxID=2935761 RepID=A0AAP0MHM6_9ROSI
MKAAEQCANENNLVRCPCKECQNAFFKSLHIVKAHLKRYGIAASYTKWVFHGEEPEFVDNSQMNVGSMPNNRSAFTFDNEEDDDEMYNLIHDMWEPMSVDAFTLETNTEENVDMIHDANREFRMCAGLLEKAGKTCGLDVRVFSYFGCIVNGVRFLVTSRDEHRTTQNNGVMVLGEHDNEEIDFYGALSNVIELIYPLGCRVVLFKCDWFDTNLKKKRINRDFHLTSINITRTWYKEYPFVLAIQAQQVSYTNDPKLGVGWKVVEKVQHRGLWDVQEKERLSEDENGRWSANEQVYQQNESSDFVLSVQLEHHNAQLYNRNDVAPQVISSNMYVERARDHDANDFKLIEKEDEDETMEEYFFGSEEELHKNYDDSDIDF